MSLEELYADPHMPYHKQFATAMRYLCGDPTLYEGLDEDARRTLRREHMNAKMREFQQIHAAKQEALRKEYEECQRQIAKEKEAQRLAIAEQQYWRQERERLVQIRQGLVQERKKLEAKNKELRERRLAGIVEHP